jgi:hypothetical protein
MFMLLIVCVFCGLVNSGSKAEHASDARLWAGNLGGSNWTLSRAKCNTLLVKFRLIRFNKGLPTQLLARPAESIVMSATTQGQGNPGEELIKLDLQ